VLLSGEAGIGKSRLVEVLREHVISQGATRIVFRCSPYHQNSALYPVLDHLQRFLQWQRDESPEAKFDTLERVLRTYRLPLDDVIPLFAALLSVPLPERYPPLNLTPQRQRQKTHEALVAWLLEEAERQSVLAVWEDLHWADPSTLHVLSLMLDQVPTARMLTLLTCRPEFRPPWTTHAPVTQITLNRLGHTQVEAMIPSLTGEKTLPTEVVEQVIAKTDGVPLFVEELVKMILESGLVREHTGHYVLTGPLPPLAIPSTLHDSLMARLDRLSTARELVQLGAVLGREFAYELLQAVSPVDELTLQQGLAQLVDAELVYQRGLLPRSRYIFKHALIQDAAYQSLLKSTRQQYHQRTAQVLVARFPEIAEAQPELVAHHYTGAGLSETALSYWQQAGQQAIEHSAYLEAIAHLMRGLEVLRPLSDTPEHTRQELTLQLALGVALLATKGYTAPEVAQVYSRARELCQHLGEVREFSQVLRGQWLSYVMAGDYQTSRQLGESLLTLAQRVHDPVLFLEAHRNLGHTLLWLGELEAARQHYDHGLARYDRQQHRSLAAQYGTDPGALCLIGMAWTLQVLGYPEKAMQKHREALALVCEIAHPFSRVVVSILAAVVHMLRREWSLAQEHTEALVTLDAGISQQWRVAALYLSGAILGMQGHLQEGITQMCQEIEAWRASGAGLFLSHWLALLAEAYGQLGQTDAALQTVAEALAHVRNTGEGYYTAESYRLRGELLLQARTRASAAGDALAHAVPENLRAQEAEACFHQALDVARRQQAKSWELRAATSLARLWQRQGKRNEAHQLLAEIYGWFTEGFDTADLQEAKTLLEELS
jgi:predicted ATPase